MHALKALVIGMGVLIVAGVIVIVVTIANRAGELGETEARSFGTAGLGLPAGTEIVSVVGAGDRLAVHARVPGEGDRIVIVDPRSGAVVGTVAAGPPR